MKVIAGTARGIRLDQVPGGKTRASLGRVRESMFARLGPSLAGVRVLDLFAGTGSLGIEALSRGAAGAVFVDNSRGSIAVLKQNLARTDLAGAARVVLHNALTIFRKELLGEEGFDVIFLDPPYPMLRDRGLWRRFERALGDAAAGGGLAPGGRLLIKHESGRLDDLRVAGLALRERDRYRHAEVSVYEASGTTGAAEA